MRNDKIIVRGAREHNLKNVSVELPRDSLIVKMCIRDRCAGSAPPPRRAR